jgi:hypothetical protein
MDIKPTFAAARARGTRLNAAKVQVKKLSADRWGIQKLRTDSKAERSGC